jgi:hypothetical protein
MRDRQDMVDLDEAVELTRTGDLWLFRGHSRADRAIRIATNAPVNHVGMALVIEDLPPLMWHAELGQALPDLWTGDHHRGAQLHDLRDAVGRWTTTYGQRAWLRQLVPEAGRAQEDGALRSIARWNGTSFPRTGALAWRWLRGRRGGLPRAIAGARGDADPAGQRRLESAFCAEVVGVSYEAMGLLPRERRPSGWYDPGVFYSGDHLELTEGWSLSAEIAVAGPA